MNTYTIFNADNIRCVIQTPLEGLARNLMEGETYVEGEFFDDAYFVKEGALVAFPAKPDYPANFDKVTEQWVWDEDISWAQLRHERDVRLSELDPIVSNPLRWAGFSAAKQTEYTDYRLALLALPSNTVDPRTPVWPTSP